MKAMANFVGYRIEGLLMVRGSSLGSLEPSWCKV
ncbi:hypothetical protein J2T07_000557 [Luteibacter jiangsuensis]|uniref:Uncharacterized protein n=1 Tax=Luteibacter jiangsuensis TaxID=637577 RepID=A0ABT9STS4_9GAMM|nr:hypothetical protein [Luteibacter jiangsuensis]